MFYIHFCLNYFILTFDYIIFNKVLNYFIFDNYLCFILIFILFDIYIYIFNLVFIYNYI